MENKQPPTLKDDLKDEVIRMAQSECLRNYGITLPYIIADKLFLAGQQSSQQRILGIIDDFFREHNFRYIKLDAYKRQEIRDELKSLINSPKENPQKAEDGRR